MLPGTEVAGELTGEGARWGVMPGCAAGSGVAGGATGVCGCWAAGAADGSAGALGEGAAGVAGETDDAPGAE